MDHFIFDQHYRSTRDSPNLLYHGFPEEPWSRPGSTLARIGKKEKSISPLSCQKRLPSTLCTFCLITLTIAQSSFAVFFGVEREDRSPKSLLYFASFFFCYHQRASEQAGKLAFFLFLRAGALQTTKSLKENSEASENIARPLHSIGNPELRSTRRYFFV